MQGVGSLDPAFTGVKHLAGATAVETSAAIAAEAASAFDFSANDVDLANAAQH